MSSSSPSVCVGCGVRRQWDLAPNLEIKGSWGTRDGQPMCVRCLESSAVRLPIQGTVSEPIVQTTTFQGVQMTGSFDQIMARLRSTQQ